MNEQTYLVYKALFHVIAAYYENVPAAGYNARMYRYREA